MEVLLAYCSLQELPSRQVNRDIAGPVLGPGSNEYSARSHPPPWLGFLIASMYYMSMCCLVHVGMYVGSCAHSQCYNMVFSFQTA